MGKLENPGKGERIPDTEWCWCHNDNVREGHYQLVPIWRQDTPYIALKSDLDSWWDRGPGVLTAELLGPHEGPTPEEPDEWAL